MAEHSIVLKPGEDTLVLKVDSVSIEDVHGKSDSALAVGRDHEKRLAAHASGLHELKASLDALTKGKAEASRVSYLEGKIAELTDELRNRPTHEEIARMRAELEEAIRLAANLKKLGVGTA